MNSASSVGGAAREAEGEDGGGAGDEEEGGSGTVSDMAADLNPWRRLGQTLCRKYSHVDVVSPRGSFFVNLLRLYWWVPAQAGYGDKWPS
jgi:hypothetical protein